MPAKRSLRPPEAALHAEPVPTRKASSGRDLGKLAQRDRSRNILMAGVGSKVLSAADCVD